MRRYGSGYRISLGEILDSVKAAQAREEKIEILRQHGNNRYMKLFLKYVFDPTIQFMLPEGTPAFRVTERFRPGMSGSDLLAEMRRMYIFLAPHPTEKHHPEFAVDNKRNNLIREKKF